MFLKLKSIKIILKSKYVQSLFICKTENSKKKKKIKMLPSKKDD